MFKRASILTFCMVIAAKTFADEILTVDLYNPKYGPAIKQGLTPCALPTNPLNLLSEIIDPKTQKKIHVFFVNNAKERCGDGSFQEPFNTLKAAQEASEPYDIIYVFYGDGTSKGMNEGIVLKDFQHLLGSSYPYVFETPHGTLFFPSLSDKPPTISHGTGNAIELASHNEVHGFLIKCRGYWGVHGTGGQEGLIQSNRIEVGLKAGGIGLEDVQGHFEISDNEIAGTSDRHIFGINIQNHGKTLANFTINGNTVSQFDEGIVLHTFDNAVALTHIDRNTIGACNESDIDLQAYDASELVKH